MLLCVLITRLEIKIIFSKMTNSINVAIYILSQNVENITVLNGNMSRKNQCRTA